MAANEVQTITFDITATAGGFALRFRSVATGLLTYNATAAQVQAALEAISTIGDGNVTVTGSVGVWTCTFGGALAQQDLPLLVVSTNTLAGPGDLAINIQTNVAGGGEGNEQQQIWLTGGPATAGSFRVNTAYGISDSIAYNASADGVANAVQFCFANSTSAVGGTGTVGDPWIYEIVSFDDEEQPAEYDSGLLMAVDVTVAESIAGVAPDASGPYEKLLALIELQQDLLDSLGDSGDNYGMGLAPDQTGLPCLTWRRLFGQLGSADAERWQYHVDTVQFDLYGTDEDALWNLAAKVDRLNDAAYGSTRLDTSEFRCKELRRTDGWKTLYWSKGNPDSGQGSDGNTIVQLSSDWRFAYLAKQQ